MRSRGCNIDWGFNPEGEITALSFKFEGEQEIVLGEDIENALNYAYRIEWEPQAIDKRFERYLIDLHKLRKYAKDNRNSE